METEQEYVETGWSVEAKIHAERVKTLLESAGWPEVTIPEFPNDNPVPGWSETEVRGHEIGVSVFIGDEGWSVMLVSGPVYLPHDEEYGCCAVFCGAWIPPIDAAAVLIADKKHKAMRENAEMLREERDMFNARMQRREQERRED